MQARNTPASVAPFATVPPTLDPHRIAHPCSRKWAELAPVGLEEKKRHCAREVHDLAAYTPKQAERLPAARQHERPCLRATDKAAGSLILAPLLWKRLGAWAASLAALFSLPPGCENTTPSAPPGAASGAGPDSRSSAPSGSEQDLSPKVLDGFERMGYTCE